MCAIHVVIHYLFVNNYYGEFNYVTMAWEWRWMALLAGRTWGLRASDFPRLRSVCLYLPSPWSPVAAAWVYWVKYNTVSSYSGTVYIYACDYVLIPSHSCVHNCVIPLLHLYILWFKPVLFCHDFAMYYVHAQNCVIYTVAIFVYIVS